MKLSEDFATPLINGIDLKYTGDIIDTCDISLKEEAENFLPHGPLYLERILGRTIWDWFTTEHRAKLDNYAYCDDEGVNRVVKKSTLRAKERQARKRSEVKSSQIEKGHTTVTIY